MHQRVSLSINFRATDRPSHAIRTEPVDVERGNYRRMAEPLKSRSAPFQLKKLDDTLKDICRNYDIKDDIDQLLVLTNNVHVSDSTPVPVPTAASVEVALSQCINIELDHHPRLILVTVAR